jgi:hypothetical protein
MNKVIKDDVENAKNGLARIEAEKGKLFTEIGRL